MSCKERTLDELIAILSDMPEGSYLSVAEIDGGHVFLRLEKPHEPCEEGSLESYKHHEYICVGHCQPWAVEIIRQYRMLNEMSLEDLARYDDPNYDPDADDDEEDYIEDDEYDNFVAANDLNYVGDIDKEEIV